jgi:hypothetical protein
MPEVGKILHRLFGSFLIHHREAREELPLCKRPSNEKTIKQASLDFEWKSNESGLLQVPLRFQQTVTSAKGSNIKTDGKSHKYNILNVMFLLNNLLTWFFFVSFCLESLVMFGDVCFSK